MGEKVSRPDRAVKQKKVIGGLGLVASTETSQGDLARAARRYRSITRRNHLWDARNASMGFYRNNNLSTG
jgi:hypothetical protein